MKTQSRCIGHAEALLTEPPSGPAPELVGASTRRQSARQGLNNGTLVVLTARFLNLANIDQFQYDTTKPQVDTPDTTPPDPATVTKRRQKQRRLDPDQILELVSQYLDGQSVRQLTEAWGIHRTTVLDHLQRHDVPRRVSKRKMTDAMVREAAKHYNAGRSLATLGQRYSVDPQTVSRELKKAGIQIRPPGRWG